MIKTKGKKKKTLSLKPFFHVAYNFIWALIIFGPLWGLFNLVFFDKLFVASFYGPGCAFTVIYMALVACYFYTQYTTVEFFEKHAEHKFNFIISSRKMVPYKNIRQIDFYRGPIGNLFNLTTVKLLSSATVGNNSRGGINIVCCHLTEDEEKLIYDTVSKVPKEL